MERLMRASKSGFSLQATEAMLGVLETVAGKLKVRAKGSTPLDHKLDQDRFPRDHQRQEAALMAQLVAHPRLCLKSFFSSSSLMSRRSNRRHPSVNVRSRLTWGSKECLDFSIYGLFYDSRNPFTRCSIRQRESNRTTIGASSLGTRPSHLHDDLFQVCLRLPAYLHHHTGHGPRRPAIHTPSPHDMHTNQPPLPRSVSTTRLLPREA